ncbi:MAG: kynureninase, partial [Rhizobiaceae bacterium]
YLDGNSLGPLPKSVPQRIEQTLRDEWGEMAIGGWNRAGWMAQPRALGDRVGRLIGATEHSVVMGDTLSIKVYQALAAALQIRPERRIVLSDNGNFPTDLYMANGLLETLAQGHELRIVAPEDVADTIDETIAAVMLTQVDYRTGRMHDMAVLTETAHAAGAPIIWDLAHSAGAVEVDLAGCHADFAIGCTYKYLNGGPGAPAFIYVRPDLAGEAKPALAGWLGHDAPFAFDLDYRPSEGIDRFRVGTPPIIQLAALEASLDIWDMVSMADIRSKSIELTEQFIVGVEKRCPMIDIASPRDFAKRGSQVSLGFEHGYAAIQALVARGVVGDFRAPDIMRFGFTPLYVDEADVDAALDMLDEVINSRAWDQPEFHQRAAVT